MRPEWISPGESLLRNTHTHTHTKNERERTGFIEFHLTFGLFFPADCLFGPKPLEEDSEEGREERNEEEQLSIFGSVTEKDRLRMEAEMDRPLPGFYLPAVRQPLRSAFASSNQREKRMSTHSVTFACPMSPYVTSLWIPPQSTASPLYQLCTSQGILIYKYTC